MSYYNVSPHYDIVSLMSIRGAVDLIGEEPPGTHLLADR